jgi:hypothetical protein
MHHTPMYFARLQTGSRNTKEVQRLHTAAIGNSSERTTATSHDLRLPRPQQVTTNTLIHSYDRLHPLRRRFLTLKRVHSRVIKFDSKQKTRYTLDYTLGAGRCSPHGCRHRAFAVTRKSPGTRLHGTAHHVPLDRSSLDTPTATPPSVPKTCYLRLQEQDRRRCPRSHSAVVQFAVKDGYLPPPASRDNTAIADDLTHEISLQEMLHPYRLELHKRKQKQGRKHSLQPQKEIISSSAKQQSIKTNVLPPSRAPFVLASCHTIFIPVSSKKKHLPMKSVECFTFERPRYMKEPKPLAARKMCRLDSLTHSIPRYYSIRR